MLHHPEFVQFLLRAKMATYAGGGAPTGSSRPASVDFRYTEGDFLYLDTYLGSRDFIGEEAVWHQGAPVWGMNYHGVVQAEMIPDGFFEILRAALSAAPAEAPYRGPAELRMGSFHYECVWQGIIERFHGQERIEHLDRVVYELDFHGGIISA